MTQLFFFPGISSKQLLMCNCGFGQLKSVHFLVCLCCDITTLTYKHYYANKLVFSFFFSTDLSEMISPYISVNSRGCIELVVKRMASGETA